MTIRSTPSPARKLRVEIEVSRAVPRADDVGDLHAELAEALGEPRAVAVRDLPGEELGARRDDPGADSQGQDLPL